MFKNGMARSKASHQANVEPHSALTPIGRDNHTAERTRDGSSSLRQQQWIVWGVGSYQRQVAMRIVALESLNARMVFMNDLLIIFTGTHRALQSCSFSPQVLHAKVVLSAAPPAVGDVTAGLLARYLLAFDSHFDFVQPVRNKLELVSGLFRVPLLNLEGLFFLRERLARSELVAMGITILGACLLVI